MKGKVYQVMVSLLLLVLLAGTFTVTTRLTPVSATEVKYLTISYLPSEMPEPATVPAVGTYKLAYGWSGPLEAPDIVNTTNPSIRYKFKQWAIWYEESKYWSNSTDNPYNITLYENITAYAEYKVQYKLTVETPYSTPYSQVDGEGWVQHPPDRWLDANTKVHVGFYPPGDPGPWIWPIQPNKQAVFEKWVINGVDDGTNRISNWFNMDGPKVAVAVWKIQYYLYVKAAPPEPRPDLVPTAPSGAGWYDEQSDVTLTADDFQMVHNDWRLRFDYWDVDGVSQGKGVNPITVHMDTNHTATAHYWLQYKLWVKTDPANIVEIPGTGFYDTCTNVTLTAPEFIYFLDNVARYTFVKWVVTNIGEFNTTTITFHVPHYLPTLPFEAVAVYKIQYYLTVADNIGGVSGLPAYSGWKEYWESISITAPDVVEIDATSRWKFDHWIRSWDPTPVTTNTIEFGMGRNATITAYYKKQYLAKWDATPVKPAGWPGQAWFYKGANIIYIAPTEIPSTTFVFLKWIINNVEYPVGQTNVPLTVTGPIDGVAVYVNKTVLYMSPTNVTMTAPATCTDFTIDVVAANFNRKRNNTDIYAIDMKITFDPQLIEIKDVTLHLGDLWGEGNYFVAKNEWSNTEGWYWLAATAIADTPGFEGTKAILTITFHVKYDPCYPETKAARIFWNGWDNLTLLNHLKQRIYPEYVYNCYYSISAPKPKLELRPSEIVISSGAPEFPVEVWLINGIKVHDYYVVVNYSTEYLDALSVSISNFLPGPYATFAWRIDEAVGKVYVNVSLASGVPSVTGTGKLFTITFKVAKTAIQPDTLTGAISIDSSSYLSVLCPEYRLQTITDGNLEGSTATYSYMAKLGDVNLDGKVGLEDLRIIAMHYGETGSSYNPYDLNRNGKVDIYDLVIVALNYERK